jgi:hypothetical protein
MSHWASAWAYEQPIKLSGRKFILVALANFADAEGFCFPGQDTLADMTGQDVRSVQRHLTALEKDGYIARKHRHKGARRTSDGYTLLADRPLKPNTTNCRVANTTNCHQDKLSPELLDHKVDPSVLKPPVSPKRSHQTKPPPEPKIPCPENILELDSELRGTYEANGRDLDAISLKWFHYFSGQTKNKLRTLDEWSHCFHYWMQDEKNVRNGKHHGNFESASERNVRYIRESLADYEPGDLPPLSENGNHQSAALLLAAGPKS